MKRTNKFIAAIFAAGAMLAGLMGCDSALEDGTKDYKPEVPTYWAKVGETVDGTVTAKWDFSSLTRDNAGQWTDILKTYDGTLGKGELIDDGTEFEVSEGKGATLTVSAGGNGFKANSGIYTSGTDTGILQIQKGSVTLSEPAKGYGNLLLKLDSPANVVIKAASASDGDTSRYVGIKASDKDGKVADDAKYIVKKDVIGKKVVTFAVIGMKAGYYKIYSNGTGFVSIDCSVADDSADLAQPAEVGELVLYMDDAAAPDEVDSFEAYEDITFAAYNKYTDEDGTAKEEDLTKEAIWTSSDESVATVKEGVVTGVAPGKAIIRARIGRFYDQRTVTVTASTKTRATFFAKENLPAEKIENVLDWSADSVKEAAAKLLKATVVGDIVTVSDATITFPTDEKLTWGDKTPIIDTKEVAAVGYGAAWNKGFGIQLKPNKYNGKDFDQNYEFATITFDVTPKSGSAVIALKVDAKGGKNVNFTPTVGSTAKSSVKIGSNAGNTSTLFEDVTISEKTTVKIVLSVADSGKNGVGIGFHDLALSATAE